MKRLELQRIYEEDRTLGRMKYGNYKCCTLELPWNDNEPNKSCIPPGIYECEKYQSSKYNRECIMLSGVVDRSAIAIHPGNYTRDILGCILPGMSFQDIDKDGTLDVAASGDALEALLAVLPDKFQIWIKN